MSGGSYDYTYRHIEEMAERLREVGSCNCASPMVRRAFAKHLRLVAAACRAIEWNDSCDGDDTEKELLAKILEPSAVLTEAVDNARQAMAELEHAIQIAANQEPTAATKGKHQ